MTDHEFGLSVYEKGGGLPSGYGYQGWLSDALGVSLRTVTYWAKAGEYPVYARAALDLLDKLPPTDWPARWKIEHRAH